MSGAVRVSELVHPPLLPLAQHHYPMPHSQSAMLVSWANYFTGACTLLGAVCRPSLSAAIHKALFAVNMLLRIVSQRAAVVSVTVRLQQDCDPVEPCQPDQEPSVRRDTDVFPVCYQTF